MSTNNDPEAFRDYAAEQRASVKSFYKLNHEHQTYDFVQAQKRRFLSLDRRRMGVWEALTELDALVDDSDPDTELSQLAHALQSAEAARAQGRPDWFVVTALIHDAGKLLCFFGEPQWAVVGDTFPVGCRFSEKVVYHDFFAANPDSQNPRYQSETGIYEKGCGLDAVHMSWGHDEYLYHVTRDFLPPEAQFIIRYHSFYAAHREGAYGALMSARDHELLAWVKAFNPCDLYSKAEAPPDVTALARYYQELIERFFPAEIAW